MALIRKNTTAWNKKSVLFVHGVGTSQPGYSEPLIDILAAADGPLAAATRWHEASYDFVNTAMAQKVTLIGSKLEEGSNEVGGFMESHVLDVCTFLCLSDTRNWITSIIKKDLVDIVRDAHDNGVMQEQLEVSIFSHSLGTMVSYETLHQIITMQAIGCPEGFKVKNFFTMGSPLAFVRKRKDTIPRLGQDSIIFRQDLARPSFVNQFTKKPQSNVVNWFNYRNTLDPIASLVPLTMESSNNALSAPEATFSRLNDGLNPHSFKNYITEYASDFIQKI